MYFILIWCKRKDFSCFFHNLNMYIFVTDEQQGCVIGLMWSLIMWPSHFLRHPAATSVTFGCDSDPVQVSGELLGDVGLPSGWESNHHYHGRGVGELRHWCWNTHTHTHTHTHTELNPVVEGKVHQMSETNRRLRGRILKEHFDVSGTRWVRWDVWHLLSCLCSKYEATASSLA